MKIIQKILKSIGFAADKYQTKYAMNGIKLDTKDGKSRARATNGRVLAQLSWDDEGEPDLDTLVNAKDLDAFGKALQKDPAATVQMSERALEKSIDPCVDLNSSADDLRRTVESINGAFPDTDCIIGQHKTPVGSVIINPELFVSLMKAMKAATDESAPAFRLEIFDDGGPLVVRSEANGISAIGAIMPITGM